MKNRSIEQIAGASRLRLMRAFRAPQLTHHSPLCRPPTGSPLSFPFSSLTLKPPTATDDNNGSTNQIIQSFCEQGDLKKALDLLSHEPSPTQRTYELLILACANQNSLSCAQCVHNQISANGFDQDSYLVTKLIGMYSDLGAVDNALELFDKTRRRTLYVWNAIFRALSLAGRGEQVLELYCRMNRTGLLSDRFTYTYVLKACVNVASQCLLSSLKKGKEVHAHVLRHGYEAQVHILTTLVDLYAKFGQVKFASAVFSQMQERNVVSWSAMIGCYTKNGRPYEALQVFWEMMSQTHATFPNSVTMVSVLQACAALSALGQGKVIHGYVLRRGLDSILPVSSALIAMYAKCGMLELGHRVFNQMERRDVVSWNSLISSYGIHGFGKEAFQLFDEMICNGIAPSPITFLSVLGACSHSGLVEEGKVLFDAIYKEYRIHPSVEHYACMVDLLGRANRLDEAAKVIDDMRIEPSAKVWGSLLGSCRIHSNVKLAERASSKLFELEPTNAGNYVLLADTYAEAEMWDEVKRVNRLLENPALQKLPGQSWTEVGRKMYSFTCIDELNPHIDQIQALLMKLSEEMKEKGYVPQTKTVLYDVDEEEKEKILLGHTGKLAVAFGLINTGRGRGIIRVTKNLRLCEDCHSFTKFISKFAGKEILVRDVNRIHHFRDGVCSCGDYW